MVAPEAHQGIKKLEQPITIGEYTYNYEAKLLGFFQDKKNNRVLAREEKSATGATLLHFDCHSPALHKG